MSQSVAGVERTFVTEEAMVNPYRIVKLGTNAGTVGISDTNDTANYGISQESASSGEPITVRLTGTSKLYVSAAVTKGARVVAAADGAGVTGTASDTYVVGIALETAAAAGIIEVMLTPGLTYP